MKTRKIGAHTFTVHPPEEGCAAYWSVWEELGEESARVFIARTEAEAVAELATRSASVFTADGKLRS